MSGPAQTKESYDNYVGAQAATLNGWSTCMVHGTCSQRLRDCAWGTVSHGRHPFIDPHGQLKISPASTMASHGP